MFADSSIAQKFTFGKTKASYTIAHGLAPYFHNLVYNSVLQPDHIVACFDESQNEFVQKGQMDIYIHYCDVNKSQAAIRYFDSSFLGHATAKKLQSSFTSLMNIQILLKNVHVSMDGPNVNLRFLDQLIKQLEIQSEKSLLDMGSCGLHTFSMVHSKMNTKMLNGMKTLLYEAFTNCSMTAKPGEQTTKKQMTVQYSQ